MPPKTSILDRIVSLRERYHQLAPRKTELLRIIGEAEISEQVYNSNAIENSTLSLEETEKVLLQVDLDRLISEREIFEARNLARVVEFISSRALEKSLDTETLLLLHKMLISNIRNEIAGRFRQGQEFVRVGSHIAPSPEVVPQSIESIFATYYGTVDKHIVKRISKAHLSFEHLHPFVDGNGRIGRVMMNYLLIRDGYVPINIKFLDRTKYYEAFQEFDKSSKTKIMEELVSKALTNSYHKRLAYLEGKEILPLKEFAKRDKQSHSNLINKAKRQTIEAFTERGIWKIGV